MSDKHFTAAEVRKAGANHIRLAAIHAAKKIAHREHAYKVGPDAASHKHHLNVSHEHHKKVGEHLAAGEALIRVAGKPGWKREHSNKILDKEFSHIGKHPQGVGQGAHHRQAIVTRRIPKNLGLSAVHKIVGKKGVHETTASAELSKPFAHEHHVLAHTHHILADHHAALADKAYSKQAPLSKPGAEVRKHESLSSQHRERGLAHAAKAGTSFDDDKTRAHLEHALGHHPVHGMKNPAKAHAIIAHFTKKIGGHDVHSSVKENGVVAKKHYMLSHAHSRLARHAAFTGDVSSHLEHQDKAIQHRKAGDKLLPEKSRETHFRKASGSLNHAVGRKLSQYAGPLREFVEKHDK